MVKSYYKNLKDDYLELGLPLPANKNIKEDKHTDLLLRELDCTVLQYMHARILEQYQNDMLDKGHSDFQLFDSTRGVFTEGGPAYAGAGIFDKSHIQICIRNPNCIKGFFMPRKKVNRG